jgi:hyperosmotically inducible protein
MVAVLATAGILTSGCTTTQSPHRQVDDLKITAEVKSKLASDLRVSSLANIDVNTTNGVVTLSGQVENEGTKTDAEAVTLKVAGVVKVNNNLQVEIPPHASRGGA